ncbi:MAG: dihydrodipicolinate synthase family protein [Armatimonadota bacterium]|nr:dihydrodipicolinate synthase family protein [Armatimonadota bacterium]MDR7451037.1 dihydrodipicolinate synthase family protein [Armatimonadota bacterium]MDR7465942.1 dihydrodipicolinate synthase family protein [Armatimonadota bacterium]MDR7494007.1 dihydrodipicolinate synthase family protein [Armatimonadota bacterium]MDR7498457.1 dihydrodipicolinate synthase family protein [Armatimonadota bacterium]
MASMLGGVYVASVTPFTASGAIDLAALAGHGEWLASHGVEGIVFFGTNGEGPSIALTEKRRALEHLFARGLRCQIVPAVMEGNLPETLELVGAIAEMPAAAVLVLPPYYFKPPSADGLRRFFEPVLAAARQPVILYHVPKYAVPVPPGLVASLDVWGVKDSGGEQGYAEAVRAAGKQVLIGTEDDLWTRLTAGAAGMISALANAVPERIVEIYALAQRGDAEAGISLSARLQQIRAMTKEYAAPAVLKRLAEARHGRPMGSVRPPLLPAPEDYDPRPILQLAGLA